MNIYWLILFYVVIALLLVARPFNVNLKILHIIATTCIFIKIIRMVYPNSGRELKEKLRRGVKRLRAPLMTNIETCELLPNSDECKPGSSREMKSPNRRSVDEDEL